MVKRQIGPSTRLFPMPTLLVAVKTGDKSANILTIAWGSIAAGSPPIIGIAVGKRHYSTPFLQKERNFTVNIPDTKHDVEADYCGIVSGTEDPDKAATCGFTLLPATKISSPLIAECPLNFECRTYQEIDFKTSILFLGEVVETHVDESILDERGRIITEKLDPLVFLPNGEYRKIGDFVSKPFSVGKKLSKRNNEK
ncbi:MAG TPA: flavin reductase family protein [Dehalococcoidales bacterium]